MFGVNVSLFNDNKCVRKAFYSLYHRRRVTMKVDAKEIATILCRGV